MNIILQYSLLSESNVSMLYFDIRYLEFWFIDSLLYGVVCIHNLGNVQDVKKS